MCPKALLLWLAESLCYVSLTTLVFLKSATESEFFLISISCTNAFRHRKAAVLIYPVAFPGIISHVSCCGQLYGCRAKLTLVAWGEPALRSIVCLLPQHQLDTTVDAHPEFFYIGRSAVMCEPPSLAQGTVYLMSLRLKSSTCWSFQEKAQSVLCFWKLSKRAVHSTSSLLGSIASFVYNGMC